MVHRWIGHEVVCFLLRRVQGRSLREARPGRSRDMQLVPSSALLLEVQTWRPDIVRGIASHHLDIISIRRVVILQNEGLFCLRSTSAARQWAKYSILAVEVSDSIFKADLQMDKAFEGVSSQKRCWSGRSQVRSYLASRPKYDVCTVCENRQAEICALCLLA